MAAKEGQKPGDDKSKTPSNFVGKSVAVRKAPSAFGKSGQADNQTTSNRNVK